MLSAIAKLEWEMYNLEKDPKQLSMGQTWAGGRVVKGDRL